MKTRTVLSSAVATTLGLALTFGLSACVNPLQAVSDQVAENLVEGAVEGQTGVDVEIDGGTIPDSWPADLPTPSGKIVTVLCGDAMGCSGSFEVSDAKGEFDAYVASLLSGGYTQSMDMSTDGNYLGVFENATTSVTVSTATDSGSSTGNVLVIIASPKS